MSSINIKSSYCKIPGIALFGEDRANKPSKTGFSKGVDFSHVQITDNFWSGRLDQSLEVGIDACAINLQSSILNFENAALVKRDGLHTYKNYKHNSNFAADSDVYKLMESMAYALQNYICTTDAAKQAAVAKINAYLNDWIPKIIAAQEENGYLDTLFTLKNTVGSKDGVTPYDRFKLQGWHELYCLGHLYEAAVALYNSTGDRRLLDASVKSFDLIYNVFYLKDTTYYTATFNYPGHEEIELALIKLAKTLCNIPEYGKNYYIKCITLSRYYLDQNRKVHGDFVKRATTRLPVSQLTEAWGHCVRAFYLYTAMTNMCLNEKKEVYTNLNTLWDNVETKTYVTGGIGNGLYTEGFAASYDLDNDHSYCETCSSISNVFWNKSMNLLYDDAKYYDNIEKQLYNNILSGIGLDGWHFYYQNRLTNLGEISRPEWYGTPCCPTNLMRLIQNIGSYIYTTNDNALTINLYIGNKSTFDFNGSEIGIEMTSDMPWNCNSKIKLSLESSREFTLRLRLPSWATGANTVTVNNVEYAANADSNGYICIARAWNDKDIIDIDFPAEIKLNDNSELVKTNCGLVAVSKGPVVFAAEQLDNKQNLKDYCISDDDEFETVTEECFSSSGNDYGTQYLELIKIKAKTVNDYFSKSPNISTLTLIPFYAWANRGLTPMRVYIKNAKTIQNQ